MKEIIADRNEKKPYNRPMLDKVKLDTEISIIMTTDATTPPDPGTDPPGGGPWG